MSNNIDMKNQHYKSYIIFSIVFFLFLFSFSAYNLSQKHKNGVEKGLAYFNRIKNSITTLYLSNNDFSSPAFRRSISNFFDSNRFFQSLVIYDHNGQVEYLYIRNPRIFAESPILTNDFATKPKYKFNKFFFNLYTSSIIVPVGGGANNLNIEVVYNIITYSEISNLIKILMTCLLIYIILTTSFLLFVPYKKTILKSENINLKEKKEPAIKSESQTTKVQTPEPETQTPEVQTLEEVQPHEVQTLKPETQQQAVDSNNTAIKYTPLINEINKSINTLNSAAESSKNNSSHTNISKEHDKIASKSIKAADKSIRVDENTGLASIEDFSPKLDYELDRAAANDTDLSLLILSFVSEDNNRITVFYNNLSLVLRNFFMPQTSFKISQSKLAVIIPDKTIEESIKKADEFIGRLKNISAIENIYAGISSRNSRIISAERLIKEAEGAVSKAISGPDQIIAFKSDPEKFREMLLKQNSI
ncbi:MAG: hypothetical protein FWD87_04660 [Spirochaetaceae bacterium]|nr:hypothetical protein [Spirochaetaceae bacterium]